MNRVLHVPNVSRLPLTALCAVSGAIITTVALAAWMLSPDLGAAFGPLDDTELLWWMNGDGRLPWGETVSALLDKSEVGRFGEYARFRPAIYVVKAAETAAFGDNVRLHYLSVIAMFVLACSVLGVVAAWWTVRALRLRSRAASALVAAASAVASTLLVAGMGSWADIATRLGPSERLAAVGFAFLLLALTALGFDRSAWWWAAAVVGVALTVLSKENFLVVAVAPMVMAVYRVWVQGRSRRELLWAALCLVPAGLLVVALAPTMAGGRDIYGASTGGSRLAATFESLFVTYRWYWVPAAGVLVGTWIVLAVVRGRAGRAESVLVGAMIAVALAWRGFDAWVYSVHGYVYQRYELVGQTFKAMALLAALTLALAAVRQARSRGLRVLAVTSLLVTGLVLLLAYRGVPSTLALTRDAARLNEQATVAYSQALDRLANLATTRPEGTVAIVAKEPIDSVETVKAMTLELQRRDLDLRIVLLADLSTDKAGSPLGVVLTEQSTLGAPDLGIAPSSAVADKDDLVCAVINSDSTTLPQCDPSALVAVPVRYI